MANSDVDLQNAVKELRTRLGMNQVEFARRISRSINTVSRYESQVAPREEALIPYAALALRSNFHDLARLFRAAIINDFGTDLELIIAWQPDNSSPGTTTSEDDYLVEAIRAFMTAKDLHPIEEIARKSLREAFAYHHPRASGKKPKKVG